MFFNSTNRPFSSTALIVTSPPPLQVVATEEELPATGSVRGLLDDGSALPTGRKVHKNRIVSNKENVKFVRHLKAMHVCI